MANISVQIIENEKRRPFLGDLEVGCPFVFYGEIYVKAHEGGTTRCAVIEIKNGSINYTPRFLNKDLVVSPCDLQITATTKN